MKDHGDSLLSAERFRYAKRLSQKARELQRDFIRGGVILRGTHGEKDAYSQGDRDASPNYGASSGESSLKARPVSVVRTGEERGGRPTQRSHLLAGYRNSP